MSDPSADPFPIPDRAPTLDSVRSLGSVRKAFWRIFGTKAFFRLWAAQMVSGLGDWVGVIAIIALAGRVSNSGAAIGLVMTARMLPGFLLAPIGGALVDRWNRKTVMVTADLGRAGLLILLPFWDTLPGLMVISFCLEVLTLMWGPAKDASVPNIVRSKDQLASANSLNLIAGFGTFPLGAAVFASFAGIAKWLGGFELLHRFSVDQESLAIWVDSATFLMSAFLISRLRLPKRDRSIHRVEWTQTYRDIVDGFRFIRGEPMVRGVMVGMAGGLMGGGMLVPLGPVFVRQVLSGGSAGFGLMLTALGVGAALGLFTLMGVQHRVPHEGAFQMCVIACGISIIAAATTATLTAAMFAVVAVGGFAGAAYVGGYTILHETVHDEIRGRIFATLYTVIRVALLLSLTLGPFVSSILDSISGHVLSNKRIDFRAVSISLPGVRLALVLGGAMTVLSGVFARRRMSKVHALEQSEREEP